ncbi:MAG: lysozyme [Ignavibacteriales bacterium]|nr:lysozyme [Ignavibacteriales bacterium]
MKKTSEKGFTLIKKYEGLSLTTYRCPAGLLTIGYGHTGKDVIVGLTINEVAANNLLKNDVEKFEDAIHVLVKVPLVQNQFDALVSFAYNVGTNSLKNSTLLKKINQSDYASAADEFPKWNKSNGKVLPGLVKRRDEEKSLWMTN